MGRQLNVMLRTLNVEASLYPEMISSILASRTERREDPRPFNQGTDPKYCHVQLYRLSNTFLAYL